VLVATLRALKLHGGSSLAELTRPDPEAVSRGLPNLEKHVENVRCFGRVPVVALNRFASDGEDETQVVLRRCRELGLRCVPSP
jgi:formate--tetrahydrofolate ligase